MGKRGIFSIVLILILFAASAGISYFLFSSGTAGTVSPISAPTKTEDGKVVFDQNLPKTEVCPLNGAKYSKQQKAWWEKHRPLGVMIENHEDSRPQSGLSSADVVYEAVAEGGITRFLSIFYCQDAGQVGPVRSARTYFLDFISEYGNYPLYAHVGGANQPGPADAISQIGEYGWNAYNDLNQFSIGFPVFWRDYNRLGHPTSTEHTMYSTTQKLWEYAEKERELSEEDKDGEAWDTNFKEFKFKDDAKQSERGKISSLHLELWSSMPRYFIDWKYDAATNSYLRKNAGQDHKDLNNNQTIKAKNIVVLNMVERSANDGYENNAHLLYGTKGSGKATIFMDGKRIDGTWKKSGRTSRMSIVDSNGKEIEFNRGLIWFEVLPTTGVLKAS